ncbi:MAG: hypothetical protein IT454_09635 [Planctomycetes bacterium]|nr:hypothetical protein [Planctomycetota bacterium]
MDAVKIFELVGALVLGSAVALAQAPSGERFDESLRLAKRGYDEALTALRRDLIADLRRQSDALDPNEPRYRESLRTLDARRDELERRGRWGPSPSEAAFDERLLQTREKLTRAYDGTLSLAKLQGVPASAVLALDAERRAFAYASHLASWREVELAGLAGEDDLHWRALGGYLRSPPAVASNDSALALSVPDPRDGDPWFQVELELLLVEGAGFRVRTFDRERRPLEAHIERSAFDTALKSKSAGADGVWLRATVQDAPKDLRWHARWDLAERSILQRDGDATAGDRERWPAPEEAATWLVVTPDPGAVVQLFALRWRELSPADLRASKPTRKAEPASGDAREERPAKDALDTSTPVAPTPKARSAKPKPINTPQSALDAAREWLAAHQSADGSWDCDGFAENCAHQTDGDSTCTGPGLAVNDVGVTGLAVLALSSAHDGSRLPPFADPIQRGSAWLSNSQDPDLGSFGEPRGAQLNYSQSIAIMSLIDVRKMRGDVSLDPVIRRGVEFLQMARNPYGAWRYDYPPTGDSDTSVTAWALRALISARALGVPIDSNAFEDGLTFLRDVVCDSSTGRYGYDSIGSPSNRIRSGKRTDPAIVNERFDPYLGEALTAAAVTCRLLLGESPKNPEIEKSLQLIASKPPAWSPNAGNVDFYYWYYGTLALRSSKNKNLWSKWRALAIDALTEGQIKEDGARGSWNPAQDCWGGCGGRVYSTSLACLTLHELLR